MLSKLSVSPPHRLSQCALLLLAVSVLLPWGKPAMAHDSGLISLRSAHDFATTVARLQQHLRSKGMQLFAEVDHAAGADKVDMKLRPTQVLMFGNPAIGTPLMQCSQTVAIDLPQKMLVWEDAVGDVWLAYNSPDFLRWRHSIDGCDEVLAKVSNALSSFARTAASSKPLP
jgi:uncharacterized protein (DUF302 family)